jgi:hypothetical protein
MAPGNATMGTESRDSAGRENARGLKKGYAVPVLAGLPRYLRVYSLSGDLLILLVVGGSVLSRNHYGAQVTYGLF